jgi:RHS repeat-associated protein
MTQSLKTPPKTSQRPLFLRKRGYLNLQKGGKPPKIPGAVAYRGDLFQKKFTGKEPDPETGLYYYGARYLDPKTSRWLSGDPALGEYFPSAPVNDEAKKHNQNLPGMGGVFNTVNMHAYHYSFNNPVKYIDPDGLSGAADMLFRRIQKKVGNYIAEYINERILFFEEHNKDKIRIWSQNINEFNEKLKEHNDPEAFNEKPEKYSEKMEKFNEKLEKFDEKMKA